MRGFTEKARSANRLSHADQRAAEERSRKRAAEATRARHAVDDEDAADDAPAGQCWLYCGVDCFVAWLDTGRCPHMPPEPPAPPRLRRPVQEEAPVPCPPGATLLQHAVIAMRGQPPMSAPELAARMGVTRKRATGLLSMHSGRRFAHAGRGRQLGGKGRPYQLWRLIEEGDA